MGWGYHPQSPQVGLYFSHILKVLYVPNRKGVSEEGWRERRRNRENTG